MCISQHCPHWTPYGAATSAHSGNHGDWALGYPSTVSTQPAPVASLDWQSLEAIRDLTKAINRMADAMGKKETVPIPRDEFAVTC